MKEEIIASLPEALVKAKEKKATQLSPLGKRVVKLFTLLNEFYPGRVYLDPKEAKNLKTRLAKNDLEIGIDLGIIIHFPQINIRSSKSGVKPRTLRDFFVKLVFHVTPAQTVRFNGFLGARGSLSRVEMVKGYNHSHISSGGYFIFGGFCMGSSELGKLYQGSLNEDQLYYLLFSLEPFLRHESVEGRPYKYLEQIFSREEDGSEDYPSYLQPVGDRIRSISERSALPRDKSVYCLVSWFASEENDLAKKLKGVVGYSVNSYLSKFLSGKRKSSFTDFENTIYHLITHTNQAYAGAVFPDTVLEENRRNFLLKHKSYKVILREKKKKTSDEVSFELRPEQMTVSKITVEDSLLKFENVVFTAKLYDNDKDLKSRDADYPKSKEDFFNKLKFVSTFGSQFLNFNIRLYVASSLANIAQNWKNRQELALQNFLNTPYEHLP